MKCSNCGMELEEDAVFCPNCGSKCAEQPTEASAAYNGEIPPPRRKKGRTVLLGIVITAAAAVVVALFLLVGGRLFSGGKKDGDKKEATGLIYYKDNAMYWMDKDKRKPFEAGEYGDEWEAELLNGRILGPAVSSSSYQYTEDGRYLYYIMDNNLYRKNMRKTSEDVLRIDKDVNRFALLDGGMLVYSKGSDGRLYAGNADAPEKIDKGVSTWHIDDAKKNLIYDKEDGSGCSDWYRLDLKKMTTERIIKNADDCDDSIMEKILYTKGDKLYLLADYAEETKIASNVVRYWIADCGEAEIGKEMEVLYFTGDDTGGISLWDFIDEDTDEGVYYRNYYENATLGGIKGTLYCYQVKTGESIELASGIFDNYNGSLVLGYVDDEDMPSYKLSKLLKDGDWSLESAVEDALAQNRRYIYYHEGSVTELDVDGEDYTGARIHKYGDGKNAVLILSSYDEKKGATFYTLADMVMKGKTAGTYTVLDEEIGRYYVSWMDDKGRNIYYMKDYEKGEGDLYRDGQKLYRGVYEMLEEVDGNVLYLTDYADGEAELYLGEERLTRDFSVGNYCVTDAGGIYYATDLDWDKAGVRSYTLYYRNGKKSAEIASDVAKAVVMDDVHVFYLTDYNSRRFEGTLMFYNGKKSEIIEDDVAGIRAYY